MTRAWNIIMVSVLILCGILNTVTYAFDNTLIAETKPTYNITVTGGDNGQITPSGKTIREGKTAVYIVKPFKGYIIDTVTVDGVAVDQSKIKKPWKPYAVRFKKIDADHAISATFRPDVQISPPFTILKVGDTQTFKVTNSRGKKLKDMTVIWSSDDQNIVSIADGIAEANAEGTVAVFAHEKIETSEAGAALDLANIKVITPSQRPVELTRVNPEENVGVPVPPHTYPAGTTGIAATFCFGDNDVLESFHLLLDGVDVSSDLTTYHPSLDPCDTSTTIYYDMEQHQIKEGIHEVTVKGTSKAGKEVTYTWSFIAL